MQTRCVQDNLGAGAWAARKAIYAHFVSKCEGKALFLIMFAARRECLEAWRQLKAEHDGMSGNRVAAILRGIRNPSARWQRQTQEGKGIVEILAS